MTFEQNAGQMAVTIANKSFQTAKKFKYFGTKIRD
jgi:hypothetical protein